MKKRWNAKVVVYLGLLVALNIILTRVFGFYIGPTIRISFGGIPLMLAGILFGPIAGAVAGIAADFVGIMIRNVGGFFIGFTLSAALVGFIPGLIFQRNRGKKKYSLPKLITAVILKTVIVGLTLNTLWLVIMYDKGFLAIFPGRVLARLIMAPIEIFVLSIILRTFDKEGMSQQF